MTTEPPFAPEPASTPDPVPDPTPQPMTPPPATTSSMSMSGETLVMIGGALVLGSYVIFQLLSGDFFQYITALVAAAFAVLIPLLKRESVEKVIAVPALMKVAGYVLAVTGVFEILYDIRFGVLDEFLVIIGALVAYAGYVLAFLGARSIKL
jgi:hypothetical protein